MSIRSIHLGKLISLIYADDADRIFMLRSDIRAHISRESGARNSGGGDFYGPFWADAKAHVLGEQDLHLSVEARVAVNEGRRRLYEQLETGFLGWWNGTRRWRNEPINPSTAPAYSRFAVPGTDGVVKVENVLALDSGADFHRLIYPYFAEDPAVPPEGFRIGLWAMQRALAAYRLEDMRILDVVRSHSVGTLDHPLVGDEEFVFAARYNNVLRQWDELRLLYP